MIWLKQATACVKLYLRIVGESINSIVVYGDDKQLPRP